MLQYYLISHGRMSWLICTSVAYGLLIDILSSDLLYSPLCTFALICRMHRNILTAYSGPQERLQISPPYDPTCDSWTAVVACQCHRSALMLKFKSVHCGWKGLLEVNSYNLMDIPRHHVRMGKVRTPFLCLEHPGRIDSIMCIQT